MYSSESNVVKRLGYNVNPQLDVSFSVLLSLATFTETEAAELRIEVSR